MKDYLDRLIELSLDEDLGAAGDVTSNALVPPDAMGSGELVAKEQLVLAGLEAFARVFHYVDPEVQVEFLRQDGQEIKPKLLGPVISGPDVLSRAPAYQTPAWSVDTHNLGRGRRIGGRERRRSW